MTYFAFNSPDTWNGFRDIDEKLVIQNPGFGMDEGGTGDQMAEGGPGAENE